MALLRAEQLPTEDLTDAHMDHFFYAGERAAPTALVGIEILGHDALLRSLAVASEYRSNGLGRALVAQAEEHARTLGIERIYLLTTTAGKFFSSLGYTDEDRMKAPVAIRETREFSGLCPASSQFMIKTLR
jgi:amino-acid N-acetyltransferase